MDLGVMDRNPYSCVFKKCVSEAVTGKSFLCYLVHDEWSKMEIIISVIIFLPLPSPSLLSSLVFLPPPAFCSSPML